MGRIGPFSALKPIVFKVVCFVLRRRVVKSQIWQCVLSPRWSIREGFIKTEFHLARFITPDFLYRQKEICFKSPPARKAPLEGSKPQWLLLPFLLLSVLLIAQLCSTLLCFPDAHTQIFTQTHRDSDYWIAWNIIQPCNNGQSHSVYMDDKSLSHRCSSLSWCIVRL